MSDEAHTEEYKGLKIRIQQDEDAQSPEDWEPMGTIYTNHNRYFAIGIDLNKIEDEEAAEVRSNGAESLAIYAYVHSGVALSTSPFNCRFDSGQCGFITMTKEKIISEYGDDSEASREKARGYMKGEIENWNTYLSGNIYGYIVEDKNGNELDSCWGYYGDYDGAGGALIEARSVADYHAKKIKESRSRKLKGQIKSRAPLNVREGVGV